MTRANLYLPGYELIEELHSHSRNVVYRAKENIESDGEHPSLVVIKILATEYPSHQELINFRHQYTIAKNLEIPGVLRLYNLQEHNRGYALVMEDFGGISLDKYPQALPLVDILKIGLQLANALHALGKQQIIHKNIQPANILIHPATKEVKIIDFSIASRLPQEMLVIIPPRLIEGNLAYIAPEQTGRMNRRIDYRSDFYALGITLYELLTGQRPFTSEEPVKLIHDHLSKIATPVSQINPEIPVMVSQIVAKLMAKNAEDRYQSALGLRNDLAACLREWQSTNSITTFTIGQEDLSDRFAISEKLYGRTTEVQSILDTFARVGQGQPEMILVAGFSGVGKTAVINEVHKPITREQGYFIQGKFDQFNRQQPFSAILQAFRDLISQLLSDGEAQIVKWRKQILLAVGNNGRVLTEVIPELEQIIGVQSAVKELSGTASQQRFNLTLKKFIGVFAQATHPLVIFLDDLQWADTASLKLLQLLMTCRGHLLLLGAYRDNEVSAKHPLLLTINEIQRFTTTIQTITLTALTFRDTNQLVADTLHCLIDQAESLTELIDRKTQGNPFFITQFLQALQADGHIRFNRRGYWECDINQIKALSVTDDVVELMVTQLQKLPIGTQKILRIAACIGNKFDLETLMMVSEQPKMFTTSAIWQGLQAGLILPTSQVYKFFQSDSSQQFASEKLLNPTYQFLHDRVQQSAYSLIPESDKQQAHLQIGRLLLTNSTGQQRKEKLFEIVNHFNAAIALLQQPVEREMLAKLNLRAAEKAKAATAYAAAYNYAQIGTQLLANWSEQYHLALALHEAVAEAAFLNGNFAAVPILTTVLLEQAKTTLDLIKTYEIIIQLHTIQKQYQQAIDSGLEILRKLGIKLTSRPNRLILMEKLFKTKVALQGISPATLLELPEMLTPEKVAVLKILDLLQMPAYLYSQKLMVVLATEGVQITLQYGNSPLAASFYAHYCMVLSSLGQLEQSYQIGQLAMTLADRYQDLAITAKVKVIIPWFSQPWQQELSNSIPIMDESIQAAQESCNLTFLGVSAGMSMLTRFFAGVPLDELVQRMSGIEDIIIQSKDESSQQYFAMLKQTVGNLRNRSSPITTMVSAGGDETSFLSTMYGFRTFSAYMFADIAMALKYADAQRLYESSQTTGMTKIQIWLFDALTRLAAYTQSDELDKKQLLQQVSTNQNNLLKLANLMPGNFQHKVDLIAAERCRVLGDIPLAIEKYDLAILGAKTNKYLQEEAIANELAAKFYFAWGKEKIAAAYMQEAYYCYARWGAQAKTQDLEQHYALLVAPIIQK
jgi:predicted ATPase